MTRRPLSALPTNPDPLNPNDVVADGVQLRNVTAEIVEALVAHNDPPELYVRAGHLTRVRTDEDGRPIVDHLTEQILRHRISLVCNTVRRLKDGTLKEIVPPTPVVQNVLAQGSWPFPALVAVTEIPTLRPDGTIHAAAGYDPITRLVHVPTRGLRVPEIPDAPTTSQVVDAVTLLEDLTADFPFDGDADRANAYAAMLTPLVRPAIAGHVPLCLLDAPEPGTGKGLLANVIGTVATGRPAAMKPMPAYDDEIRKMITSTLLEGATVVVLDNIDDAIRSPHLASLLTAETWSDRILGRSETVELPNRATWLATGNNLQVGGDLARRCYRIRLDLHQAKPYLRSGFRHDDLIGWTLTNRGQLLGALLTLARAWWAAGRPQAPDTITLGNFTPWAHTIGGILHHAGVDGFLANQLAFLETADTEAGEWEAFLTTWNRRWDDEPITVANLVAALEGDGTLRDSLPGKLATGIEKPGYAQRLGKALRAKSGRHYGDRGFHVTARGKNRDKVETWSAGSAGNKTASQTRNEGFEWPDDHTP